jgi:FkbM family methyltransferase
MRVSIKNFIKNIIFRIVSWLRKTKVGEFTFDPIVESAMHATQSLTHQRAQLVFTVPNNLNRFRVDSFSIKEPETLEWIDGFQRDSVLWDVGANVGLYSCYAAKTRGCKVFAFEPSVFNLELLARNVYLNNLTGSVAMVPLPLSNTLGFSKLNMTSTDWGGALSTFGQDYGWDGHEIKRVFEFQTLGLSADDAVRLLQLPQPNHIKIDVDGIEHLILFGARNILTKVDSVLIEINDGFTEQAEQCRELLLGAGLVLKEKRHSEMLNSADSFGGGRVWNQIWIKTQPK